MRALDDQRLRQLIAVGRGLVAELDVESVLDRLLDVARDMTGARYAALGILDDRKRELERFLTRGIDEAARHEIGSLPRGRGILGVLIDDPRPLRLADVGEHPRSFGFPIGHPPMTTFLGVPILIRGEAWGNLYLTEKAGGEFDAVDEESVTILAEWAAIAIENARLYREVEGRREELERAVSGLEATTAIARAVGGETQLERVLELIVKRGRALVNARALVILLCDGDDLEVAAMAGELPAGAAGARMPLEGTVPGQVLRTHRPERLSSISSRLGPVMPPPAIDARTALLVPLTFRGSASGVLAAFDRLDDRASFDAEDERLLLAFAASAATAVATAKSVEEDRLRHSIAASEQERRRWARELHDETLQGLGGLRVLLSSALRRGEDEQLRSAVASAVSELGSEIDKLRTLITELRPAALDELGLQPAVENLVRRVAAVEGIEIAARIEMAYGTGQAGTRLLPELESTIYRLIQEALANVVKHARAEKVRVEVIEVAGTVEVAIADDGHGFDPTARSDGFGLLGMRERVELVNGELGIKTEPGSGTTVRARLPATHRPVQVTPLAAGS